MVKIKAKHGQREIKTTVLLPEPIWRLAKIRALDERRDLRRVIIAAITLYVKQPLPRP